ncbi:aryl hydrocarbon receptor nuclear translocator-like protein 1 isoform X2 [Cataglyphis hispanica]|uniref:aryl hydrocarbon receptor nuclear translocator-like protein 1 isoform X2 n=1 Tax=Cataglyphis hispanica TaxID=1086592 RepID=UPI00217F318B|nr:aryl hydrocarbon receptor nuclear translocator-like protein 1 isoform X2 [Cataglyphis hispanica]
MKDDVDEDDSGISSGTSSSGTSVPESTVSYGNPRASRNMAEKQRRDNLNTNISTMASLVPIVAGSSRRMDKISILRLAAAFLRIQYIFGRRSMNFLSQQFNEFDLEQYFVDHIVDSEGFFLIVTATGKIVYVSRQVEHHLGHVQNELLGQSLIDFVHPDDHDELKRNLISDDMQLTTTSSPTGSDLHDYNSSSSDDSTTNHNRANEKNKQFHEQRRRFKIRIAQRIVNRREHTQYETFDISGVLRLAEACKNADNNGNRGRHREITGTSNDIIFAGVATLPKKRPITELSIMDATKDEYMTRHLVDGRIVYCDHRVSIVAGYLSEEVSGQNAFGFMHKADLRWTMVGLRQMYSHAETCGTSCYRLLTKSGKFIYLRTHGYLEFDKNTKTVESFVCINTLVSEKEGIQLIKEMRERFAATPASKGLIKNFDINSPIELDLSQLSNPEGNLEEKSQLEEAINHLIRDLPSASDDNPSPSPKTIILSPDTLPFAEQTNKVDVDKIDSCTVLQGKDDQIPKQESKEHKHTLENNNVSSAEQCPISDSESMMNDAHNNHNNVQNVDMSVQSNILATTCEANMNPCQSVPLNHISRLDVSQNVNGLNAQVKIEQRDNVLSPNALRENDIKLKRGIETFNHQTQELVVQYFDDSASDSSVISQGIETHNQQSRYMLKRVCSDEDLPAIHSKRRSNNMLYASTNANDEQQYVSYVNCGTFTTDDKYSAVKFNQYYDVNSQPLLIAESPNSSLDHEIETEFHQLVDPAATNIDEEQYLQDLKNYIAQNSDLSSHSEIMKIFNNLHNGSVIGFENHFNEAKLQQFSPDHQIVNDQIRRTCRQLASNIKLQESQINMLASVKNSVLHAQRENLSQLQIEHNMQKQMLKTLQQDHHKMQIHTKHNFGI